LKHARQRREAGLFGDDKEWLLFDVKEELLFDDNLDNIPRQSTSCRGEEYSP
jgi:hypothetical protein